MCGIAGTAGNQNPGLAEQSVRRMTAALARRGPDAEGLETFEGATLGHRRLSIFDLSEAGRQPMTTADGALSVVFNGAIYNFRELRRELERAGHAFRTQTDTEVLLHGYREWGIDRLVERSRGMFAFGLWDARSRKLYLVRDRLGVKPLIYAIRGNEIAFASTARALRHGGFVEDIDPQAIAEFLEFGYVTDDRTIYRGAHKAPAGHILEWTGGRLTQREYWHVPQAGNSRTRFEDAVAETEELFLRAVKLRLDADVPVGALLSGGVDSSLVCWAVAKLGADISAFTIGTKGDPLDESEDARQTARALGIRHEVIDLAPDDTPGIEELVSAYGEPFACGSALGMLRVSRAVRSSATVLLTGDGGDDVFLGYPEHRHFFMAQKLARFIPSPLASLWNSVRPLVPDVVWARRSANFLAYATGGLGAVTRAHPGISQYRTNGMLGERLAHARVAQQEIDWSPASGRRVLQDFLDYEHRTRFLGEYMTKVDGGAMYHALEARAPFLDQEIWNMAARLPFDVRLNRNQLKAILREIARRHLGERVAAGRKRGFGIPVSRWMVSRWRPEVENAFEDSLLGREGWINPVSVLSHFRRANGQAPIQLWYLFVLENWLRNERQQSGNQAPASAGVMADMASRISADSRDLG